MKKVVAAMIMLMVSLRKVPLRIARVRRRFYHPYSQR
jgi:hypothetical protein